MSDTSIPAPVTADARRAWLVGGSLMLGSVAVDLVSSQTAGTLLQPWIGWVGALLWAASLAVFALGIRGQGSVVGRRPGGVAALLVGGIVPLVFPVFWSIGAGPVLDAGGRAASMAIGYAQLLVPAVALLIAVVVIARADAVPPSVRWMPAIVFACNAAAQVLAQIAGLAAPTLGQQVFVPLFALSGVVETAGSLLLGILAVVYGLRRDPPPSVQVYPAPERPFSG